MHRYHRGAAVTVFPSLCHDLLLALAGVYDMRLTGHSCKGMSLRPNKRFNPTCAAVRVWSIMSPVGTRGLTWALGGGGFTVRSDDELDALLHTTESARNTYFDSLGDVDGNWQPIVNPRFADGPAWPTRPGWQRIISGPTTIVASSGLTDPWFESEGPNNGLGIETVVATNDELPSDVMQMVGTWLYQFSVAVANAAAADRRFALRHDKFGIFLFGVPHEGLDAPNEWVCGDGCFGSLIGIPIPNKAMRFTLPGGEARLLTAKLLTPDEYSFVADEGLEGAHKLNDLFVADGSHYLSSICRQSVI